MHTRNPRSLLGKQFTCQLFYSHQQYIFFVTGEQFIYQNFVYIIALCVAVLYFKFRFKFIHKKAFTDILFTSYNNMLRKARFVERLIKSLLLFLISILIKLSDRLNNNLKKSIYSLAIKSNSRHHFYLKEIPSLLNNNSSYMIDFFT